MSSTERCLADYGAYTSDGRQIVLYPHCVSVKGMDALSMPFYQLIDEAIETGKLELPEMESDEI